MPIEKHGKGHEQHHVHKEETAFKVTARRNKLAGLWAAGRMGLSGEAAEAYAKDVVLADFEEAGDQDVIRKIMGDLDAKGLATTETEVKEKLAQFEAEARDQLHGPH